MQHKQLLDIALQAAQAAGKAIMEIYESGDFGVEAKVDDSPLTLADRAGHEAIVAILESTEIPILSEEGAKIPYEERKNWEQLWIIDPLDGTKEFIKKNGEFTVNIALIEKNIPVLGVVLAPVLQTVWYGTQGAQAFKQVDGQAPRAIQVDRGEVKNIVASRSHLSPETADFIAQYPDAEAVSMGSSLKFLLVAEGTAQLYPRFAPTMEWDTAAAQAVVEAAGGQVLIYPDKIPLRYNREDLLNPWFLVNSK
ncbi:MAG: 3'(2'),5'-bisphosphate nucleotidase CysQ [Cyclobacteriaceae bacterium]|nr:3'(2'),5'-bisphosphate nucleotidase CysQ [Cyclobacteriaceae bacterium]MCH8517811.1 3'(2'),5'-bisphosphate nucleotidase CysQ [Cyclobacteriaceae bacterium]